MKKKVMLHYCDYGVERSPSIEFDKIQKDDDLAKNYDFYILNQKGKPSEIGTLNVIKNLYKQIREIRPDVVHISGVQEGFYCVIAAWLAGCKNRIMITHGFASNVTGISRIKHMLYKYVTEPITTLLSNRVQCNSQFSKNQFCIRKFGKGKSHIVYNYLSAPAVKEGFPWRTSMNISDKDTVICIIGNIVAIKGFDTIAKVINTLNPEFNVRYVIIGDGNYREKFENAIDESKREDMIFLGRIEHTYAMQVLSESNIFFLPSELETLGMVFAEAGHYGIPVVATKVGGINEIVDDGKTGFLTEPGDYIGAADCLLRLIRDQQLADKMGEAAKKKSASMFSEKDKSKQIALLYEGRFR